MVNDKKFWVKEDSATLTYICDTMQRESIYL